MVTHVVLHDFRLDTESERELSKAAPGLRFAPAEWVAECVDAGQARELQGVSLFSLIVCSCARDEL